METKPNKRQNESFLWRKYNYENQSCILRLITKTNDMVLKPQDAARCKVLQGWIRCRFVCFEDNLIVSEDLSCDEIIASVIERD